MNVAKQTSVATFGYRDLSNAGTFISKGTVTSENNFAKMVQKNTHSLSSSSNDVGSTKNMNRVLMRPQIYVGDIYSDEKK